MLPLLFKATRSSFAFNIAHRSLHTFSDTYINYVEKCDQIRSLLSGRSLHARLIITGLARLTHYASKLIAMYVFCGETRIARQLFDRIPQGNYRRWIVLLGAYAKCGFYKEALGLCREMQDGGVRPDNYVLPSVLKACGHMLECLRGREVHGLVLRCSFEFDAFVNSALIDMYSKCGKVEVARWVFDGMRKLDLVGLNAMVSGYVQGGFLKEALALVEGMKLSGVTPNVVTWNTLISGFAQEGDDLMVDELLKTMQENGVDLDVVSWTSIISGFVHNFRGKEAFAKFRKMLSSRCFPSSNTISSLLPACANVANMKRGREIHGYAVVTGVGEDVYVKSALLDMYAKCGLIVEAGTLFKMMPKKNSVTWNSMIFGYANHGHCDKAISLFQEMEAEEKNKLDHLTFTAGLTACSYGGMVELGKYLFESMQEEYKIKPRLEHYACMVDLLGRAEKITEAYDFIKGMPVEPDFFVWGALLGACRQHGEIDLAEEAAKHLAVLEPRSVGNSLLLSNLYAGAGSWSNAVKVKKGVNKKKLKRFLGCSWIETGR
ncbi:hypothetical protein Droror1_Dr00019113 [Drosera rotundifolia]